jgi:hypothetical protein
MKQFLTMAAVFGILVGGLAAQPPVFVPGVEPTPTAPGSEVAALEAAFPHLPPNYRILEQSNPNYNAISYIIGTRDRWVNPPQVKPDNPLGECDALLAQVGYRRLPSFDLTPRLGKQKVAAYAKVSEDGSIKEITHVALQHADGSWSCKIGKMQLIQIADLNQLRGTVYGVAAVIYERDVPVAPAPGGIGR